MTASYDPKPQLREQAIDARQAAVLFIDTQNYNCHRDGAIYSTRRDVRQMSCCMQITIYEVNCF